jgi:hypothetical protein
VIRVVLPPNLKVLAHVNGEVKLDSARLDTQRLLLDELETRYPMLRGTIRDFTTPRCQLPSYWGLNLS